MELRQIIDNEVERHGLPALRAEQATLERELWALGRREAELRGSISLWDRWMIFSDTPAEVELRKSKRRRSQVEKSLQQVRQRVSRANAAIATVCPPFAAAVLLGDCIRATYTDLKVEGRLFRRLRGDDELREALGDLAELLRTTYFPALEFAGLRARLAKPSECQNLAGFADLALPTSAHLGYAPLAGDRQLGHVATRLLDNDYFVEQAREPELLARTRDLANALKSADAEVKWWDRLNILWKSPTELARDQAMRDATEAEDLLRRGHERQYFLLHDAMRAYPPLDFYHGVVEALGVAARLDTTKAQAIADTGKVVTRHVVAYRAPLLAALRRLQGVFAATFPGVPRPEELAHPAGAIEPGLHEHPSARAFIAAAERSALPQLRDELLAHAAMAGQTARELAEVAGRISLVDRLVFWSDTADERVEDELTARKALNVAWTEQAWSRLLAEARSVGARVGPLAIRDAAIVVTERIGKIHTDAGSSSFPKNCQVYGRDKALAALTDLRNIFLRFYGVPFPSGELIHQVAAATPVAVSVDPDPVQGVRRLEPEELCGLLAHRLASTNFGAIYRELGRRQHELGSVQSERTSVEAGISLWDKINIFTTTDAEAKRDELRAQIRGMSGDINDLRNRMLGLFHEALAIYPPALLAVEIDAVAEAIAEIRASCQSYTVTTGSGKNRRTETRYRCVLHGKDDALAAIRHWCADMVEILGEQLVYPELLEAFELAVDPRPEVQS